MGFEQSEKSATKAWKSWTAQGQAQLTTNTEEIPPPSSDSAPTGPGTTSTGFCPNRRAVHQTTKPNTDATITHADTTSNPIPVTDDIFSLAQKIHGLDIDGQRYKSRIQRSLASEWIWPRCYSSLRSQN